MAPQEPNKIRWKARRRVGLAGVMTLSLVAMGSSAFAEPDDDPFVSITNTVDSVEYDREYHWSIAKSGEIVDVTVGDDGAVATANYQVNARPNGFTDSNVTIRGKASLTGATGQSIPGNRNVTVTDVISGGSSDPVNCEVSHPFPFEHASEVAVEPGETITVDYECSIPGEVGDVAELQNTATATWTEGSVTDNFTVAASADVSSAVGVPTNEINETVTFVDDEANPGGTPKVISTPSWHDGAKVLDYFLDHDMGDRDSAVFTNTAWIQETEQSESITLTATRAAEPSEPSVSIEKTADVEYDRQHFWEIEKSGEIRGGTTADYEVKVTPAGYTDYGIAVTGVITLTGDQEASKSEEVTVTDVLSLASGDDVVCETFLPGTGVVPGTGHDTQDVDVHPGESTEVEYYCAIDGDLNDLNGATNVATATWTDGEVTDNMSVSTEPVPVNIGAPTNEFNTEVTVVDDKADPSGQVTELGTVEWNSDGVAKVFSYSLDHAVEAGECADFTNTAWIQETEQSASATVEACADAPVEDQSGAIIDITRDVCTVKITTEVAPSGDFGLEVWDDGEMIDAFEWTMDGAGEHVVTWMIDRPAGEAAPGVGFVLLDAQGDVLDSVDPWEYPAEVADQCAGVDDPADEPKDEPTDKPIGDLDGPSAQKLPDTGVSHSSALVAAGILAALGAAIIVVRRSVAGN